MPNKVESIFEVDALYKLKFVDYERVRPIPHRRLSASVKVLVVRGRGTRVIHEFTVYFHKDEKRWLPLNDLHDLQGDFHTRAVAALNKHFPKGVVRRSTKSAAA